MGASNSTAAWLQVMGLLQGKVQNDTFIVIDSFALPVEGTETRVNAQAEAYEYMVDFQGTSKVAIAGYSKVSYSACLCKHLSTTCSDLCWVCMRERGWCRRRQSVCLLTNMSLLL